TVIIPIHTMNRMVSVWHWYDEFQAWMMVGGASHKRPLHRLDAHAHLLAMVLGTALGVDPPSYNSRLSFLRLCSDSDLMTQRLASSAKLRRVCNPVAVSLSVSLSYEKQ
ncbi:hypothetical protein J3R82DRAFT_5192, partial [Butyriboletus roseoflavus]